MLPSPISDRNRNLLPRPAVLPAGSTQAAPTSAVPPNAPGGSVTGARLLRHKPNFKMSLAERQSAAERQQSGAIASDQILSAASHGNAQSLESLIGQHGLTRASQAKTEAGETALMLAVKARHHAVIALLLSKGVDASRADNEGNTALSLAAAIGDLPTANSLLDAGINPNPSSGDKSALVEAVTAGHEPLVNLLLTAGADIKARNKFSDTVFKIALDKGHEVLANRLADDRPEVTVTDPRIPRGETWLTEQFQQILDSVKDPDSKPSPHVLQAVIHGFKTGEWPQEDTRNVSNTYWEHILLRYAGDIQLDIKRNYSTELQLSLLGTFKETLLGHAGINESARLLNSRLPTTAYDVPETKISEQGGWATERWGYHDPANQLQVTDGIDTFLIEKGKIKVKMINYNIEEQADTRSLFEEKLGMREPRDRSQDA